ncbi:flagellar protein FlgN [Afifella sp. IM 167]|uniref:flagellar protein FlgN n=1 Tax=Afifella sp. IM 167 TaxID=2033586 RepID=UPI001CCD807E|nr:flagellar protein FlgN [Afifella sp. IM 167]MBZ8131808.1 flagellar protein FlgN [Afifella sp. IM 167]
MKTLYSLPSGPANALAAALHRLEEIVDEENTALTERLKVDLDDMNHRKSRALLELTRTARAVPVATLGADAKAAILRLREKLARNSRLLETNIAAVRRVADLLSHALHEADSDGTYSARGAMTA